MLSPADNVRLTQVGPGTPAGALMRRYWQPFGLSMELPENDGAPIRVRLLGEDLVAFRDTNGAIGLVDAFCPHRRAPMFFGRNEACGLRCAYHGWKFDRDGACVDMPDVIPYGVEGQPQSPSPERSLDGARPELGRRAPDDTRIAAYPTWEGGGMVWAYLGPPAEQPAYPDYEFVRAPETHRFVSKQVQDCNYLQALEGGLDSSHATIMHRANIGNLDWLADYDRTVPKIAVDPKPYGYEYSGIRSVDGKQWVRLYQYIMPGIQMRGRIEGLSGGNQAYVSCDDVPTINGHVWVPMDDETVCVFNFLYSYDPAKPVSRAFAIVSERRDGRDDALLLPDFRSKLNRANDYAIDRALQKTESFTGIDGINTQDVALQEGMGILVDRSKEHLGTTDRAIIVMRKLMLEAIDDVAAGRAPRGVDAQTYRNVRALDHIVPGDVDWRTALAVEMTAKF